MRVKLIAATALVENIPGYIPHEIGYPPQPTFIDELGEEGGRLCYTAWKRLNKATLSNEAYLANILDKGHFSVTEHGSATFYIDGVTRNLTHELIRHRHLSYSEVSQRYVDIGSYAFVEHPGMEGLSDEARQDLLAAIDAGRKAYQSIMKDRTAQGMGRKQARQVARHALVSGTETKILVSGNMRAWRDMLWKRLDPAADDEIRLVAKEILVQLKRIAPNTFQDFPNDPQTMGSLTP